MKTVNTVAALRQQVAAWRAEGLRIGFVPTMGNLHEGHLALIDGAVSRADRVVCSIFVNPLQFGVNEDLDAYPRTLAADSEQLSARGTHLLFAPTVAEMYPQGGASATVVSVPSLSGELCGASRPGHFDGVATVVSKLFNQVQPDVAVFGRKDFQQLRVIEQFSADLAFPVEVIGLSTVRAADGLALSSRNQYLTAAEREIAPQLRLALVDLAAEISTGANDWAALEQQCIARLTVVGFKPDYIEIRSATNLVRPAANESDLVVLAAAWLGKARLLDNIEVIV